MMYKKILIFLLLFTIILSHSSTFAEQKNVKIKADSVKYGNNYAIAKGNAVIKHGDTTIKGDQITYNIETGDIEAIGNAHIIDPTGELTADSLTYNMHTENSSLISPEGWYAVDNNKNEKEKIYFYAATAEKKDGKILLGEGSLTTCELPRNSTHYSLTFKNAEMYPSNKIVLHHSKFKYKRKNLIGYGELNLSLKKGDNPFRRSLLPTIGHNNYDGWYIKNKIDLNLLGSTMTLMPDWYEKTGFGTGLSYPYTFFDGRLWGKVNWYNLQPSSNAKLREDLSNRQINTPIGRQELNTTINYALTKTLTIGAASGYFEYLYPNAPAVKTHSHFFHITNSGSKEFYRFKRQNINYNSFQFSSNALDYGYRFSDNWVGKIGFFSQDTKSLNGFKGNYARYYAELEYSNPYLNAILGYEKASQSSMYTLNREPELSFYTKQLSIFDIPVTASCTIGHYNEQPTDITVNRATLSLDTDRISYALTKNTTFTFDTHYRQIFCDNGSSKYDFGLNSGFRYDIGDCAAIKADYYRKLTKGRSPLLEDFTPEYNILNAGIEFFSTDKYRLSFLGGYDYLAQSKTSLLCVAELNPSSKFKWVLSGSYNMNIHEMNSLTSEIHLDLGNGYNIENWALYDVQNHKFTYQDIGITKESHDFFTKFIYRSKQKEFLIQFHLKAFPDDVILVTPNVDRTIVRRQY